MRSGILLASFLSLVLALPALSASTSLGTSQAKKKKPLVADSEIDKAVAKGVKYLAGQRFQFNAGNRGVTGELMLLALAHSGVGLSDSTFNRAFKDMLKQEPEFTYRTALRAMVLEEVERNRYQAEIHKCAQFFCDNQGGGGRWDYGHKTTYPQKFPKPRSSVASGSKGLRRFGSSTSSRPPGAPKPKLLQRVPVRKNRPGNDGDNSNTQYAALGIRACFDAGIVFPKEVLQKAQKWLRDSQEKVGGGTYAAAGWHYGRGKGYGSMTVGAVAALSIYDYMLKENWKRDPALQKGVLWIAKNFTLTENPGKGGHHYYYLYGLERAGRLYETDTFGKHDWYQEGARYLVDHQGGDGKWKGVKETAFALLFLTRATAPLVASEDKKRR